MQSILLNASGHPLSQQSKSTLGDHYTHICDIPIPVINPGLDMAPQICEIFNAINNQIKIDRPVSIILPGYPALAVIIVAYLHGLLGHFPEVCILEATSPGLYLPTTTLQADMAGIRVAARRIRRLLELEQHEEADSILVDCVANVLTQRRFSQD